MYQNVRYQISEMTPTWVQMPGSIGLRVALQEIWGCEADRWRRCTCQDRSRVAQVTRGFSLGIIWKTALPLPRACC